MTRALDYCGLQRHGATQWSFVVGARMVTRGGLGQGGALGGAALAVFEAAVGRPVVWATTQFVRPITEGQRVDIELDVDVHGHQMTQANLTARVGGHVALRVLAAAGQRRQPLRVDPHRMPRVPAPADCPVLLDPAGRPRVEVADRRLALGRQPNALDGPSLLNRTALWCRLVDGPRRSDVVDLSICADFLATGISDVAGVPAGGNSIDNTLRVVEHADADWLLAEVHVDHVAAGFAQAGVRVWSPAGRLMALGSQTVLLRTLDADGQPLRTAGETIAKET